MAICRLFVAYRWPRINFIVTVNLGYASAKASERLLVSLLHLLTELRPLLLGV